MLAAFSSRATIIEVLASDGGGVIDSDAIDKSAELSSKISLDISFGYVCALCSVSVLSRYAIKTQRRRSLSSERGSQYYITSEYWLCNFRAVGCVVLQLPGTPVSLDFLLLRLDS